MTFFKTFFIAVVFYCNFTITVEASIDFQQCPPERTNRCIKIYRPVCALRETGFQCYTTPCPTTEKREYSNSCIACADDKVQGYWPGHCFEKTRR